MNFEDLLQTFENSCLYWPVQRPGLAPRKPKQSNHPKPIYTFDTIHALMGILQQLSAEPLDLDFKYSIRYLVHLDGRLTLAREGQPSSNIPSHREMGDVCLAAGNIFFNETFTEIIAINNQSGDFIPSPSCLVWALKALLGSGFRLSDDFTVRVQQDKNVFNIPLTNDQQQQILALNLEIPKPRISPISLSMFSENNISSPTSPAQASSTQASAATIDLGTNENNIIGAKRKLSF